MASSAKTSRQKQEQTRRRWKKRQENRPSLPDFECIEYLPSESAVGPVEKLTLDVLFEAIPDPLYDALPQEWRNRLDPIYLEPVEDLASHIDLLKVATVALPHIPGLWNMLGNAYMQGAWAYEAGEVFAETVGRFPHYFFGHVSYAGWLIQQGRIDEVADALGGDFNLQRLLGGRTKVHVSELIAFHAVEIQHHLAFGDVMLAAMSMNFLEQLDVVHPTVIRLRQLMTQSMLSQATPYKKGLMSRLWGR
jgi:hypothetical protein